MLNDPRPVRRLPLPATLPPYDDELPVHARSDSTTHHGTAKSPHVQGALALALYTTDGLPTAPPIPAPLQVVGEPLPSPAADLPDPRKWAARVAVAALECLYGPRPVQQLLRWTDERVYESLIGRVGVRPSPTAAIKGKVRTVRTCSPAPDVVEATVVAQAGNRVRSVALRLEARHRKWLCTALDVI